MKSIIGQLHEAFSGALVQVVGEEGRTVDPLLRQAGDEKFGDYQSNVAMSLAKRLGKKPRDLAEEIVAALQSTGFEMCEKMEIAGPGFINLHLSDAWLRARLNEIPGESEQDRVGVEPVPAECKQTVVVDYSGPNIAKQMHVGHIRSTIIGDTFARVLDFQGHNVIRQNHIGDWGTQFGMLCAHLKEKMPAALERPEEVHLSDLEAFYKEANARDKEDTAFHERARAEVVALHRKEPATLRAWEYIVEESRRHYMPIYQRLGVSLGREHERGESFYAELLPDVVKLLEEEFPPGNLTETTPTPTGSMNVRESDGALCIFHRDAKGEPIFKNPEGEPFPFLIRKSDGAFLYATTDLAALKFRIEELGADRVVYVTDARQAQHFEMLFTTARIASWTHSRGREHEVQLDHATFGSILGEDRKPLKTRSGENIKLAELLDEAVQRAEQLIRGNEDDPAKKRGFAEDEIKDVAEAVGVGAIKYADLSQNRQSDYVFSWDKMLAMDGNTAPYLMYAYARVRSIYRKGGEEVADVESATIALEQPAERALGRQILRFAETVESVSAGLKINLLTDYLYDLSGEFMRFYEQCPVLRAETAEQRASRLRLCGLTARTLRIGLNLLGIRVVEQM